MTPVRRMNAVPRLYAAAAAASVSLTMALPARAADSPLCPDPTDVAYSVKMDDTLWNITARSYCLTDWPPLFYGWKALAEYNKTDIGSNPDLIYAGTVVCLPERITRGKWHANCPATLCKPRPSSTRRT